MDKTQREQNRFIRMLNNECGDQFALIKLYHEYLANYYEKNKEKILYLENKLRENNEKINEIIGDFDLIKFIDKDDKLMILVIYEDEKLELSINSFIDVKNKINSFKESIKLLKKFNQEHKEDLLNLTQEEKRIIDQINSVKKAEPKKKWGLFVTEKEKNKVQNAYDNKISDNKDKLRDIMALKHNILFNIEHKLKMINKFEKICKYLSNLPQNEKDQIVSYYNKVKVFYDDNDIWEDQLKFIENNALQLSQFVKRKTKEDPKYVMVPLLRLLNLLYENIPEEMKKGIDFEDLTKVIDFGEHKHEIDTLLKAVEQKEFGKTTRSELRQCEKDHERKLKKLEEEKKKKEQEKKKQEEKDLESKVKE